MKTSELTGVLLDFYVAKAEGHAPKLLRKLNSPAGELMWHADTMHGSLSGMRHKFSEQWELAGPIIERENLLVAPNGAPGDGWHSRVKSAGGFLSDESYGQTPLVAAMRAYVALRFGEEVPAGTEIQNG
ncbi:phage protein NinX family protein [uncultured Variovorax sp.]|jgi:hypothetical protein|uniref:phage protein NinX family protein n=1 Tax=uncultured Variovorax sp. TaxID=114708 RepID=UPI00261D2071|nr:phage protein NinX family protein [uncultured Variovorax sp.]